MGYDYHIIVIGAGSGGLVAAAGGAFLGARVALVEMERMGGDCLNAGCVPSKAFLRSARLAAEIRGCGTYGLNASPGNTDLSAVMKRVSGIIGSIAPHDSIERFTSLGVDVIQGKGVLQGPHAVTAGGRSLTGRHIVIATGSAPSVPAIPGLEDVPYLTNRNIFSLKKLPEKLIVLGGGPIGLELGQGFRHLGSQVEIIDMAPRLFPGDDREVWPLMEGVLREEGIELTLAAKIVEVKKKGTSITVMIEKDAKRKAVTGSHLLVALGRVPRTGGMGLESAGVDLDGRGFVKVNRYLQSTVKNIYACGDCTGPFQFTHMAGYQAGIVIRNILFPLVKSPVDYSLVTWTTFTRPEVAHAGSTEEAARESGRFGEALMTGLGDMDRARTENDTRGFLKLVMDRKRRIIGATMVGSRAGEIIPLASLAIRMRMTPADFTGQIFPYPVEAEIFRMAGLSMARRAYRPWMKYLVKKILLR